MRAGKLNRRIAIQGVTSTSDSTTGQVTDAWVTSTTIWAHIDPLNALEVASAGQTEEHITHRVTIRYRADISPQMRFLYGTRVFNVHRILDPDEAHRELICECEEVVTGQVGAA